MHRVIEHIDCHLDEQLELADLATVANFSAFHFHRLFAAWMGEMLGDRVHALRNATGCASRSSRRPAGTTASPARR